MENLSGKVSRNTSQSIMNLSLVAPEARISVRQYRIILRLCSEQYPRSLENVPGRKFRAIPRPSPIGVTHWRAGTKNILFPDMVESQVQTNHIS